MLAAARTSREGNPLADGYSIGRPRERAGARAASRPASPRRPRSTLEAEREIEYVSRLMSVERAATALHSGVLYFKLAVWTAFALVGPVTFLLMRNYLGVAITGGIGVFIGLAIPTPEPKRRAVVGLRAALVAQGLAAGGYGAYVLSRPAAPWVHGAGGTRTAVALAQDGKVYALEFTERSPSFHVRDEGGAWASSAFPGQLASDIALGPGDTLLYAREDRRDRLWSFDSSGRWAPHRGFSFRSVLAASDLALFIAETGALYRLDDPKAEPRLVPGVAAGVVCARGLRVLAVQPPTEERRGRAWRSDDGGASFREIPGASLAASSCGIADDGALWVAAQGTFSGVVSVAGPGGAFEGRALPAPRVEAIAVNPSDGREAWVGTWGAGVYRSLDAGATWEPMGLEGYEVSALAVDFKRRRAYAGAGSGVYERPF